MKKNLISILLLVGAVTLNLSMLSQVRCAGSQDRHGNALHAASTVAPQRGAVEAAHLKGHEIKALSGSDEQHGFGVKCVGGEGPVHLDFNFIVAAVELPPKNHAQHVIQTVIPVFTSVASVPQDRPPKPLA